MLLALRPRCSSPLRAKTSNGEGESILVSSSLEGWALSWLALQLAGGHALVFLSFSIKEKLPVLQQRTLRLDVLALSARFTWFRYPRSSWGVPESKGNRTERHRQNGEEWLAPSQPTNGVGQVEPAITNPNSERALRISSSTYWTMIWILSKLSLERTEIVKPKLLTLLAVVVFLSLSFFFFYFISKIKKKKFPGGLRFSWTCRGDPFSAGLSAFLPWSMVW